MSPPRAPVPHASVQLPPLNGHEALIVVNILERLISAIWCAHGPAMQATLEDVYASVLPSRRESSPSDKARTPHLGHDDFPF